MQVTDKIEQLKAATSVRWKTTLVKTIHFETLNFGGDIKIKLVGGRKRISVKLDELTPDGDQRPATSDQRPANL